MVKLIINLRNKIHIPLQATEFDLFSYRLIFLVMSFRVVPFRAVYYRVVSRGFM